MAAAAGLACGLPGVSFDLPVFKTYYPQGFLRVETGDLNAFSQKIIDLLKDKKLYQKMSKEAVVEAETWDWEQGVLKFLKRVKKL